MGFKSVLTLAIVSFMFVFAGFAAAYDVAISTKAGWYGQAAADRESDELAAAIAGTVSSVELFTPDDNDALAAWVEGHTNNGRADVLVLNGQFPESIYTPGNVQVDDSIAELFLDDGNVIMNTGDYMFYVVNDSGANAADGLATMMDIPGITMWDDNTAVTVTAQGANHTPSLSDFQTDRPFHLDELDNGWEPLIILAQNDAGTRADPVAVRNADTGGILAIFYQTAGQDDDPRSEVMGEFINSFFGTTAVDPTVTLTTSWGAVKSN